MYQNHINHGNHDSNMLTKSADKKVVCEPRLHAKSLL